MLCFELSSVPSVNNINSDPPTEQLASKQGVVHKPPEVKQLAYVKTVHQHRQFISLQQVILMNLKRLIKDKVSSPIPLSLTLMNDCYYGRESLQ
jgi:hypothetical protein